MIDYSYVDEVLDGGIDINFCYLEGDFYVLGVYNDGSFDDFEVIVKFDDLMMIIGDDFVIVLNSGWWFSGEGERWI